MSSDSDTLFLPTVFERKSFNSKKLWEGDLYMQLLLKTFFNKCLKKNERDTVIDKLLVVQDDLKIINIVNELA